MSRLVPNAPVLLLALALSGAVACDPAATSSQAGLGPGDYVKGEGGKADASVIATVLDFEFDGVLVTDFAWDAKRVIQDQLLYTIGHLNGDKSVGRLDRVDLSNVVTATDPDGRKRVTYHARMPVAWGSKTNLPAKYAFTLPLDVSYEGQRKFTEKYKDACVDWGAHDVDSGSMWYYYRPARGGCALADADVVRVEAAVAVSAVNTTGKYPEYHKVWEDQTLRVVAVFGKYEDGATSPGDAGIAAYDEFVAATRARLAQLQLRTTPETVPQDPGVQVPDVEFHATLADGRTVIVNALLVDNVAGATAAFYDRYEALSTRADLIAYNGHAGLGQNVRALAKRGVWTAGQYVIVFMNGCDTFAYVDGSLAETRAAVNPDDPEGSRYLDFVVNAMPAYFASDSEATLAIVDGLLAYATPRTYEVIFKGIDPHQVVLVTGEQDNVYHPGYGEDGTPTDGTEAWTGLLDEGTVAADEERRFETPALAAGAYVFEISGQGDADLYVRVGSAPTETLYDCRPYRTGSDETCEVDLTTPAVVHVMVRGWADSSTYVLLGSVRQ
ncbi:MAG: PPC domain-containing protein [Deltaproteobacteria bacterium]|nr:PPC domain-containing protein [Deltaproteobacteria bacterium]